MELMSPLLLASLTFLLLFLPFLSHAEPFEFLDHLKGCKKGDTVKGVKNLKKYLNHFGYLNYDGDDDDFDDLVESAIKTYQRNYNLNVTGTLDPETVKLMMMPRCGFPDIINKKKDRHLTEFHIVSHFSFFPNSPRWPRSKTRLTYALSPAMGNSWLERMRPACARAFARWAVVSHFTFRRISNYQTADIKISFQRGAHGDNSPFDGRGGVLAHAYPPPSGDFHYDVDELWIVGARADYNDLESVAVHEIGHLLGLHHSSVRNAVMYPTLTVGTRKLNLHRDDINGIRTLYNLT